MLVSIHGMLSAIRTTGTDRNSRTVWVRTWLDANLPIASGAVDVGVVPVFAQSLSGLTSTVYGVEILNTSTGSTLLRLNGVGCVTGVASALSRPSGRQRMFYAMCSVGVMEWTSTGRRLCH